MNALAAIWGGFLNDAKSAVGAAAASSTAAAQATAAQSATALQTEAGSALQATGVGAGAAIAPAGSAPKVVAWLAGNWELVALAALLWFLFRRR